MKLKPSQIKRRLKKYLKEKPKNVTERHKKKMLKKYQEPKAQ